MNRTLFLLLLLHSSVYAQTNYFWNGGNPSANPANGGSGLWTATNAWRQPTSNGSQATWSNGNNAILEGVAGVVSINTGSTVTCSAITVKTTNYTITSNGNTATTLNGNVTLDPNVELRLNDATTTDNRTLYINSVNGGANSSLRIQGSQTGSNASRVDLNAPGASINVPVILNGNFTSGTPLIGIVGRQPSTAVNATITNNSGIRTMLGSTSGNSLAINGAVQGTAGVQFSAGSSGGAGTVILNAPSTYGGNTLFNMSTNGTVRLGVNNALPTGTAVTFGATSGNGGILDLNAFNQTIASLSSNAGAVGRVINNATGTSTLTINGSANTTFSLPIEDGTGSGRILKLVKSGTGELTLAGTNTFTGGLEINNGKIILGNANIIANTCSLRLNGGTFRTGATTGFNETMDMLHLTDNSTIELGTGNHTLTFANSSSATWTSGKTLTIKNWAGAPLTSGLQGKIVVGPSGLTAAQLAQITFDGFGPGAAIIAGGEVVPVAATLIIDPTNIAPGNFGSINAGLCSTEKSFDVSGSGLPSDVVITPPAGFQISTTSGSGFTTSPITLTVTGGILPLTTIYVKFCPTAAISYSGNITVTSGVTQNVSVSGTGVISTYYSQGSGTAETDAIWSYLPSGTPQTIASLGGFSNLRNVHIQTGHHVVIKNSLALTAKDLVIEAAASLKGAPNTPGASIATPYYINVHGNIQVDGELGNAGGNDSLGLNYEGPSGNITGTGTVNLARIRKSSNVPTAVSTLSTNININLYWSGTALYNNQSGSTFNFTQNAGTINFVNSGDFTVDGTNGLGSGNRNGTFTFNGTVVGADTIYAYTDNTSGTTGITIGPNGVVNVKRVIHGRVGVTGTFNFNVSAGGILNIFDFIELQTGTFSPAGNVILKSTAQNHCAYINNFSTGFTGVYNGNVRAERYVPVAGSNQHYTSVPVSGVTFADLAASGPDEQFIIPTLDCDETKSHVSSPYGTHFEYVDGHQPPGQCMIGNWKIQSAGPLVTGRGYSMYLTGNASFSVTGQPFTGNTTVPTFNSGYPTVNTKQGTPIQSGWNLVGNPYPSAIDLVIDRTASGFSNEVQVWQTSGPYSGSWQSYVINGTPGTVVIPPFQAFFVRQTVSGAGNYPFYQSERSKNANVNFYALNQPNTLTLELETQSGLKDLTRLVFTADATAGYDPRYDATKMAGAPGRPTLFSYSAVDHWLSINTLPELSQQVSVPIGLRPEQNTTMTLSVAGLSSFDPTVYVYLEDKLTGVYHNLRNGPYQFTTSVTDNYYRFVLHLTPPVQINITNAGCQENSGKISITQNGPAVWSYTLTQNDVSISSGTLSETNSINLNEVAAGIYTLTLTDALGYSVVKNIVVNGPELPNASFKTSATNAETGQWIEFTPDIISVNHNYIWNFGDGTYATTPAAVHAYASPGIYQASLKVNTPEGCEQIASQIINVTESIATHLNTTQQDDIAVWMQDKSLHIKLLAENNAKVTLLNALGQVLLHTEITGNETRYDLRNYAGVVYVRINHATGAFTRTVIIQ
ncbi:MAG: PKD domain-containing protein [Chitinophagales bacterium]|nr:PKD domain-containing protein [Chitinophagales bacterium]MDW8418063.1 PKD domain-containing protein [Chitinophagales bacterium]